VLSKQSGVARQTWKFDDNGNCIDNAYFGVDGNRDELEAQLTRNGYDLRNLVEQFDAKPAEI
jgi:hypothetical protein